MGWDPVSLHRAEAFSIEQKGPMRCWFRVLVLSFPVPLFFFFKRFINLSLLVCVCRDMCVHAQVCILRSEDTREGPFFHLYGVMSIELMSLGLHSVLTCWAILLGPGSPIFSGR